MARTSWFGAGPGRDAASSTPPPLSSSARLWRIHRRSRCGATNRWRGAGTGPV